MELWLSCSAVHHNESGKKLGAAAAAVSCVLWSRHRPGPEPLLSVTGWSQDEDVNTVRFE